MLYQQIIIGGGAAGLYFASFCPVTNGLILERARSPGRKLLLSGSGQCNLTHGGSIKDFIGHYGPGGSRIRSALYKGNNLLLMKFFTERGVALTEREDGKVFPRSMKARQVLELLLSESEKNGWELKTGQQVSSLSHQDDGTWLINGQFAATQVIVASGGCSYPDTGSDGSMFPVLEGLGLKITSPRPALVPLTVQQYPYRELSGISFPDALVEVDGKKRSDGLLLTHSSFSGPAVLNLSRYAHTGSVLKINYVPAGADEWNPAGDQRQAATSLSERFSLPKRFAEVLLARVCVDPAVKAASLTGKEIRAIRSLLTCDTFSVSGTSGFGSAMATKGGVSLDEVDLKTFESKRYPGLFIIGEALDIDGDTGGYNLQFAFSSGYGAAQCVLCSKK